MTPDDIMAACPTIYPRPPICGFDCPDGWLGIVERLSLALEAMYKGTAEPLQVEQVKEKFGGLRFYVAHASDDARALIAAAENESLRTCEQCGRPGRNGRHSPRSRWWIRTLCDEHAAPDEPPAEKDPTPTDR